MANQYKNKIIYGGDTLIDLTVDDVTKADVLSGKKFHLPSGEPTTGTCTFDADTSDATAVAGEILAMTNNGAVTGTITTKAQQYTIPQGFHDGSGKVSIASTEQAKLIATNIRQGVTILGVEGTMSGSEDVNAQTKTVTPGITAATYTPDTGYNYFSEFTVSAIPYTESDNAAGGVTVTIAAAS